MQQIIEKWSSWPRHAINIYYISLDISLDNRRRNQQMKQANKFDHLLHAQFSLEYYNRIDTSMALLIKVK